MGGTRAQEPVRITGGELRGRPLVAPRGLGTRPTADKVRGAIFNVLAARGAPLAGAAVLDLFAGTGSLGIEALSRGAARAVFVEAAAAPLAALERNLARLGLAGRESHGPARAAVLRGDALRVVERLAAEGARFDLVFLDPPYAGGLAAATVEQLAALGLVAPGGLVVAEHGTADPLADRVPGGRPEPWALVQVDRRRYGRTVVTLYERV